MRLFGKLRERYQKAMMPVGAYFSRTGLSPNILTAIATIISLLSGMAFYMRSLWGGVLLILLSAFFDMLDGAVARASGRVTRFGAVLDHVLDRYAEYLILIGIALGGYLDWFWAAFALFGMVMASFTRAKAESVGGLKSCTVGIAERQEKLALIIGGAIIENWVTGALAVAVVLAGVLSHITVIQRLSYTLSQTKEKV
jgi:phosphatidylglycerophosphate synthase